MNITEYLGHANGDWHNIRIQIFGEETLMVPVTEIP